MKNCLKFFKIDSEQGCELFQQIRCIALCVAFLIMVLGVIKAHCGLPGGMTMDVELPTPEMLDALHNDPDVRLGEDRYDRWLREAQELSNSSTPGKGSDRLSTENDRGSAGNESSGGTIDKGHD